MVLKHQSSPQKKQHDCFEEAPHQQLAGESEAAFKAKLVQIARQKLKDEVTADIPVTVFPARRAKGALSAVSWSASRVGMRDKANRVSENNRQATKRPTKPTSPGTKR